jgi:hypothetical protein
VRRIVRKTKNNRRFYLCGKCRLSWKLCIICDRGPHAWMADNAVSVYKNIAQYWPICISLQKQSSQSPPPRLHSLCVCLVSCAVNFGSPASRKSLAIFPSSTLINQSLSARHYSRRSIYIHAHLYIFIKTEFTALCIYWCTQIEQKKIPADAIYIPAIWTQIICTEFILGRGPRAFLFDLRQIAAKVDHNLRWDRIGLGYEIKDNLVS